MEQTNNIESKKAGPKDVLSHLFGIVLLYISTISFGTLAFQIINIIFPDQINYLSAQGLREAVRWPVAILTLAFPAYLIIMSWLQRDLMRNPEKREIRTRKWLIYITLFITALVILVDLITLIYRFLGGELPTPFLLKVLTVLVLAILVFFYHLWILKNDRPALKDPKMKWFVYAVIVLGLGLIVSGYYFAGAPKTERMRKLDEQRVSDLQSLQYSIQYYWQAKQKLPTALIDLKDDMRGTVVPSDPETKMAYEYQATGTKDFKLCATFKASNEEDVASCQVRAYCPETYSPIWAHPAEKTCFTRTIDPDLYPPLKDGSTVPTKPIPAP